MALPTGLSNIFNFSINWSTISTTVLFILAILLFIGIIGAIFGFIIWQKKYVYKIVVYRKLGNTIVRTFITRGKPVRVSQAGDYLWFIRGVKKWLTPANLQSAKNEYWYFIRSDGEWINFMLDDIDELQKLAGAKFVDTDMRMNRLAIESYLKTVFKSDNFWKKHADTIMMLVFVVIVTVCLIVLFTRLTGVSDAQQRTAQVQEEANLHTIELIKMLRGESTGISYRPNENSTGITGLIPV